MLKCFLLLLDRLASKYWEGKADDTAALTFSVIKDNKVYGETLRTLPANKSSWLLHWIEAFVKSLSLPALNNVFPLIMQFLCEELQHELYDSVKPTAMFVAAKVSRLLTSIMNSLTVYRYSSSYWLRRKMASCPTSRSCCRPLISMLAASSRLRSKLRTRSLDGGKLAQRLGNL